MEREDFPIFQAARKSWSGPTTEEQGEVGENIRDTLHAVRSAALIPARLFLSTPRREFLSSFVIPCSLLRSLDGDGKPALALPLNSR